jgi:hypothetical protein
LICLIPSVVGLIANHKINTAESHEDLVAIGIVMLLFCNLISGILMLCMHEEDL